MLACMPLQPSRHATALIQLCKHSASSASQALLCSRRRLTGLCSPWGVQPPGRLRQHRPPCVRYRDAQRAEAQGGRKAQQGCQSRHTAHVTVGISPRRKWSAYRAQAAAHRLLCAPGVPGAIAGKDNITNLTLRSEHISVLAFFTHSWSRRTSTTIVTGGPKLPSCAQRESLCPCTSVAEHLWWRVAGTALIFS